MALHSLPPRMGWPCEKPTIDNFMLQMEPVEKLSKIINGNEVYFYFLKMKSSIFIWVGRSPATMKELAVAMHLPVSAYSFNYITKILFHRVTLLHTLNYWVKELQIKLQLV